MTKGDLINEIASKTGLSKTKAGEVIEALISTVGETLSTGEKVSLVGFGTWETSTRQARKGRNPKNGAEIEIPAKTMPRFRAGANLIKQVSAEQ